MPAPRKTPLKLLPELAAAAREDARQHNRDFADYVGILLWNYAQLPSGPLEAEPASPDFARLPIPCHIRGPLWALVRPQVERSGLSANAFIEALIARRLRSGERTLTILPARNAARGKT